MSSTVRASLVKALRSAAPFDIPDDVLDACLHAAPELVAEPARLKEIEPDVRRLLLHGTRLPAGRRAAALPVLGNIAEAVVETLLVEAGWAPLADDTHGRSFGHGVDLLMADPTLERVVGIEVKSTVQHARWPRVERHGVDQLSPEWLDKTDNPGMHDVGVASADVYVMVAQVHFTRRCWRAIIGPTAATTHPVKASSQLTDIAWIDP